MTKISNKPALVPLSVGKEFKTFRISGKRGMKLPSHISTKEAVVVVQKGKAILKMEGDLHELEKGEIFIVPAGMHHSLLLLCDFKAIALMAVDSEIEFD